MKRLSTYLDIQIFVNSCQQYMLFQCIGIALFLSLLNLLLCVFFFWCYGKWNYFLKFIFQSVFMYSIEKITDFHILIYSFAQFQKPFMSQCIFLLFLVFMGLSIYSIVSFVSKDSITYSFPIQIPLFFPPCHSMGILYFELTLEKFPVHQQNFLYSKLDIYYWIFLLDSNDKGGYNCLILELEDKLPNLANKNQNTKLNLDISNKQYSDCFFSISMSCTIFETYLQIVHTKIIVVYLIVQFKCLLFYDNAVRVKHWVFLINIILTIYLLQIPFTRLSNLMLQVFIINVCGILSNLYYNH